MKKLTDILSEKIGAAFAALDLPAELGEVRFSDRPDLAQFQCNGAMAAAKQAGRAPREIATDIIAKTDKGDLIDTLDIAGPGFINISLTQNALQSYVNAEIAGLGEAFPENGQTIVLDYGGPNVGKPMHVGHLRSAIIGDTLRRILSFAGFIQLIRIQSLKSPNI